MLRNILQVTGSCSHRRRLVCLRTLSEIPILTQVAQAGHYRPVTKAGMAERELTLPNIYSSLKKENHRRKIHWDLLNAKKTPLTQGLNTSRDWESTIYCHAGLTLFPSHLLQATARGNILDNFGSDPVGPFSGSYYSKPRNLLKPIKCLSWKTWHMVFIYSAPQQPEEHLKL